MMPTEAGQALLDTFDRIRIINLKHRADRRREMTEELTRLGLSVDGALIAFHEASKPDDRGEFPTIGARGCFQSHLAVLKDALAAGSERLLILEDDLDFSRDVETRLPPTLGHLRATSWGIFYGGYEQYPASLDGAMLALARSDAHVRTTHFLAFARPAIEALVPYLEQMLARKAGDPEGGPMHVDGAYSWFRETHPQFETWLAVPILGDQRPSKTDIHPPGLLDRIVGLGALLALARRLKRQWSRHAR